MNTLFTGFKYKYSQEFLDSLAKAFGIEWTKVESKTIPIESVTVSPLSPPTGHLDYLDLDYENKTLNI
jgi:hypothetical protein